MGGIYLVYDGAMNQCAAAAFFPLLFWMFRFRSIVLKIPLLLLKLTTLYFVHHIRKREGGFAFLSCLMLNARWRFHLSHLSLRKGAEMGLQKSRFVHCMHGMEWDGGSGKWMGGQDLRGKEESTEYLLGIFSMRIWAGT
jgi:hypothetical protein